MNMLDKLYFEMIDYYKAQPSRIQHFAKVHSFARLIAIGEGLDEDTRFTLEAAAYVHDIGIKPAEEKYGSCAGPLQEKEGVEPARKMLTKLGFEKEIVERVCWLVAHHHTYTDVTGMDYRILLEADFLVNLFEDDEPTTAVKSAYDNIFKTETGRSICRTMFSIGGQ